MSKRIPIVDFGPVALSVSGSHEFFDHSGVEIPCHKEDVVKLQRLMQNAEGNDADDDECQITIRDSFQKDYPASSRLMNANAVTCLKLASSVAAATGSIATRVELTLSPDWIPQSIISVEKKGDQFHFDLHVQDAKVLNDLSQEIGSIACSVGTHLKTSVILHLYNGDGAFLVNQAAWQPVGIA